MDSRNPPRKRKDLNEKEAVPSERPLRIDPEGGGHGLEVASMEARRIGSRRPSCSATRQDLAEETGRLIRQRDGAAGGPPITMRAAT